MMLFRFKEQAFAFYNLPSAPPLLWLNCTGIQPPNNAALVASAKELPDNQSIARLLDYNTTSLVKAH